ncbi:MAG: ABC transporter permease, partial [Hyphomicrobiales bacterium]
MIELARRLLRTPQGAGGIAILVLLAATCLLGGALAPHDPEAMNVLARFRGPGSGFWLGSDEFGRDTLSRLLVGARATVPLAVA